MKTTKIMTVMMVMTVIITIYKKTDLDVAMKCHNSIITIARHILEI
jgi:hypothetical protein